MSCDPEGKYGKPHPRGKPRGDRMRRKAQDQGHIGKDEKPKANRGTGKQRAPGGACQPF